MTRTLTNATISFARKDADHFDIGTVREHSRNERLRDKSGFWRRFSEKTAPRLRSRIGRNRAKLRSVLQQAACAIEQLFGSFNELVRLIHALAKYNDDAGYIGVHHPASLRSMIQRRQGQLPTPCV